MSQSGRYEVTVWHVRLGLYYALILWSFLLFCLSAARINYTTHLSHSDPLNGGRPFTDPSVAELLFTSIITLLFAPSLVAIIHRGVEHEFLSKTWFEVAGLFVLWLFWLGGTAAATDVWPASLLASCAFFEQCARLQALLAFAWLGWLTLSALFAAEAWLAVKEEAWFEHTHAEWSRQKMVLPMREALGRARGGGVHQAQASGSGPPPPPKETAGEAV